MIVKIKMLTCKKRWHWGGNDSRSVWLKNTSGSTPFWALMVVMVLVFFTFVFLYRLVNIEDKIQTALDGPVTQTPSPTTRYPISQALPGRSETSVSAETEEMVKKNDANHSVKKPFEVKKPLTEPIIKAIRTEDLLEKGGKVFIELNCNNLPEMSIIKGEHPRVICDFYGLSPAPGLEKSIVVDTGIIRSIRLGIHPDRKPKTRVVIDLVPNHKYIVEQQLLEEENTYYLDIHFK